MNKFKTGGMKKGCANFKAHPAISEHCVNCGWGIKLHSFHQPTNLQDAQSELRQQLIEFASQWEHPWGRMKTMDKPLSAQIDSIHTEMVNEIMQLIKSQDERVRDSEKNQLFSVMRHLGIKFDAKAINRLQAEWKESARKEAERKARNARTT